MENNNQLFKIVKRIAIGVLIFLFTLGIASYFTQRWLEYNIEELINADENRAYNVSYESLDLNPFFKGFKLDNVNIDPLNKFDGTIITCQINRIVIDGLNWRKLIINRQATISEIAFISPDFKLSLAKSDTVKGNPSRQIQEFFGDILSRVEVNRFRLVEGSFIALNATLNNKEIGHIGKINIDAKDIETDSLQWKHLIPFKTSEFSTSFEDVAFNMDENTTLSCSSMEYLPNESSIKLNKIELKHNKNWRKIARSFGQQKDIFEMYLESLSINGITANDFMNGSFDIHSESLIIDQLKLTDHKDKNLPIYDEIEKSMFSKMVAKIPFELNVDTIIFKNTSVEYTEIGKGKSKPGTIHLNRLNGNIYGFSTVDSLQEKNKEFTVNVSGQINNEGHLQLNLSIPYHKDAFRLKAKLKAYNMKKLNTTIEPMLGIVVESGELLMLDFDMRANNRQAENKLIMHYKDLKLTVLDEDVSTRKKRGLITGVANTMIRDSNLPTDKNYIEAKYTSKRNIYRAPFNFIWFSIQDGLKEIVPTKMAKELMENNAKKSSKKKKKRRKK